MNGLFIPFISNSTLYVQYMYCAAASLLSLYKLLSSNSTTKSSFNVFNYHKLHGKFCVYILWTLPRTVSMRKLCIVRHICPSISQYLSISPLSLPASHLTLSLPFSPSSLCLSLPLSPYHIYLIYLFLLFISLSPCGKGVEGVRSWISETRGWLELQLRVTLDFWLSIIVGAVLPANWFRGHQ